MTLPADLNMTDVQLAALCRKQDAEIDRLRAMLKRLDDMLDAQCIMVEPDSDLHLEIKAALRVGA